METLLESYINFLYDPNYQISKEIQGPNIPVEHDNRPNWIRECMLLDENKEQINCLRRLKEMTAMNPFYQYRIDRFIDAITQTYEPTDNQGTVPGNELTESVIIESTRNIKASREIESVLKCGSLPKQYKNYVELSHAFDPLEIYSHVVGDHKIKNMLEDVITKTIMARKILKDFPSYLLVISSTGYGDDFVLSCKDGKVYLTSHDYAGYTAAHKQKFDLNKYLTLFSKDFKSYLIKRGKESSLTKDQKIELAKIIKDI